MDLSRPVVPRRSSKLPYPAAVVSCQLIQDAVLLLPSRECAGPTQVAEVVRKHIGAADREYFVAVYVNARNTVLAVHTVSIGTLTASLVHPREVFKPALLLSAAGVIVAHNHPSGEVKPSPEDRAATSRIRKAGEILGVPLLDHVIVGAEESFYSFREGGALS